MSSLTTFLIVLGVLAIAALSVTFGFRRSTREPKAPKSPKAPPVAATETDDGGAVAVLESPVSPSPVVDVDPAAVEPIVKARLRDRLGRTRSSFSGYLKGIAGRSIDSSTWDDLEEGLLLADVGIDTTTALLDAVKARVKEFKVTDPDDVVALLRAEVESLLERAPDRALRFDAGELNVWMFVGVNGVGKTTSIGKLSAQHTAEGYSVLLAAGDTFRAAAAEQLTQWATKTGAEIVRGQEGADPGSIVFDAMSSATSKGIDLLLIDTAGRLHNKNNLMAELEKLKRIVDRTDGALKEVLLVLDATTGQNGLQQAKVFAEVVDVTGIVLTKLDGTAKGGIVLAIQAELGLPVKAVGVGETAGDLIEFDPREFAAALFED
jgi:fused signal recognition particle receptor